MDCGEGISAGTVNGTAAQYIGVYGGKSPAKRVVAIGGSDNSSYQYKSFSVLIHWGKNCTAAERKAQQTYDLIAGLQDAIIGSNTAKFAEMLYSEPKAAGRDERGVYEYVVDFSICYERVN